LLRHPAARSVRRRGVGGGLVRTDSGVAGSTAKARRRRQDRIETKRPLAIMKFARP
jgi:hypothetical protein